MTATDITVSTLLVAIDISKHRHEVLIGVFGKKRRRRMTILNTLADLQRLPVPDAVHMFCLVLAERRSLARTPENYLSPSQSPECLYSSPAMCPPILVPKESLWQQNAAGGGIHCISFDLINQLLC